MLAVTMKLWKKNEKKSETLVPCFFRKAKKFHYIRNKKSTEACRFTPTLHSIIEINYNTNTDKI